MLDVRWIDDDIGLSTFGEGLLIGIRQRCATFDGTRQHELQSQAKDAATEVTIEWDLPAGVTGTIESESGSDYGPVEMTRDGSVEEAPEEIEGGYVFRGKVFGDPGVPEKWRALRNAMSRHDVDHVAEEAAYTWFNRLALRIL